MTLARFVDKDGEDLYVPRHVREPPPATVTIERPALLDPSLPQLHVCDRFRLKGIRRGHLVTGDDELVYEYLGEAVS